MHVSPMERDFGVGHLWFTVSGNSGERRSRDPARALLGRGTARRTDRYVFLHIHTDGDLPLRGW